MNRCGLNRGDVDGGGFGGDEVGDQAGGHGAAGEADVAVAEGVDDGGAGAGAADDGDAVGGAGAVAHPEFDAVFGEVFRDFGDGAGHDVAEHAGAGPVGGGFEAGEFDGAGDAEAGLGGDDGDLGVVGQHGVVEADVDALEEGVVAAFGFQADAVAGGLGEVAGAGAGGDDGGVAFDLAGCGGDGAELAGFEAEAGGAGLDAGGALGFGVGDEGGDVCAGVEDVAAGLDEDGEGVAAVEGGLLLAQGVGVEFGPGDAVVAAQAPGEGLVLEGGAVGVGVEEAAAFDEVADAGFVGQAFVAFGGVGEERAEGAGGGLDAGDGEAGADEAEQPGEEFGQVGPADGQRAHGVGQVTRHFLPQARHADGHDGAGVEDGSVAVAGGLFAAGLAGFDDGDAVAVADEFDGAGGADDAGADDDDVARHVWFRRRFRRGSRRGRRRHASRRGSGP